MLFMITQLIPVPTISKQYHFFSLPVNLTPNVSYFLMRMSQFYPIMGLAN